MLIIIVITYRCDQLAWARMIPRIDAFGSERSGASFEPGCARIFAHRSAGPGEFQDYTASSQLVRQLY
jgi:hypothetical protein